MTIFIGPRARHVMLMISTINAFDNFFMSAYIIRRWFQIARYLQKIKPNGDFMRAYFWLGKKRFCMGQIGCPILMFFRSTAAVAQNSTKFFSWNHKRINFQIIFKVCTYDNWAASVKCAMCQATNNKKVLTENQHNNRKTATTSSTSDIYKMGATSLSRSTSPQLHGMWLFFDLNPSFFVFIFNFWPRPVLLTSDFGYLRVTH